MMRWLRVTAVILGIIILVLGMIRIGGTISDNNARKIRITASVEAPENSSDDGKGLSQDDAEKLKSLGYLK
jgi:hypothetical protein